MISKHQERRQICGDLEVDDSPQVIQRWSALSSSGGYEVYDEEYVVEYSGDLWTKREGVIRVLCFVGNNMNLLLF